MSRFDEHSGAPLMGAGQLIAAPDPFRHPEAAAQRPSKDESAEAFGPFILRGSLCSRLRMTVNV
jgi:hypothetical protein